MDDWWFQARFTYAPVQADDAADVHDVDAHGNTPLMRSCASAPVEAIRGWIARGSDVQHRNHRRQTALMLACEHGRTKVVLLLAEHGANVRDVDDLEDPPLFYACRSGFLDTVRLLVARGCSVRHANRRGVTALMIACRSFRADMVAYLIEQGSDVDARDECGESALFCACACGNEDAVRMLLARGADVHARDVLARTALMRAARLHSVDVVRLLVQHGANVDDADAFGETALFVACGEDRREPHVTLDMVRILLDAGADPNACSTREFVHRFAVISGGSSVLMVACMCDPAPVAAIRLLLERGADARLRTAAGSTALRFCAQQASVVPLLVDAGAACHASQQEEVLAIVPAAACIARGLHIHHPSVGVRLPLPDSEWNAWQRVSMCFEHAGLFALAKEYVRHSDRAPLLASRDRARSTVFHVARSSRQRRLVQYMRLFAAHRQDPSWLGGPGSERAPHGQ
jgi:ankyrin repeat protein